MHASVILTLITAPPALRKYFLLLLIQADLFGNVKVNASLGFARPVAPARAENAHEKHTRRGAWHYNRFLCKKKEPFQRYSYYITPQYKGQAFFMPKICVVKRYDPFSLKKEENERYNVFIRLETVGLDVY